MNIENISGYTSYANSEAMKLAEWALEENDRIKATKLKRIADEMEDRYRDSNEYKRKKIRNMRNIMMGEGVVTVLKEPLWRPDDKDFRMDEKDID